jgi:hypothetical protein
MKKRLITKNTKELNWLGSKSGSFVPNLNFVLIKPTFSPNPNVVRHIRKQNF